MGGGRLKVGWSGNWGGAKMEKSARRGGGSEGVV